MATLLRSAHRFVCALAVAATASTTYANLITNGSFEDGPTIGPADFLELAPDSDQITGWVVTRDEIDYVNSNFWETPDGDHSLDLDGTPGFGGIAQDFATEIGTEYLVEFDLASSPGGTPTIKEMRVEAAGQSQDFTFDSTGKTVFDMGWVRRDWTFTAVDTNTTLEFYSLNTINGNFGPALDNVSVTVVPEPASAATVGLLAALFWNRRIKTTVIHARSPMTYTCV